MACRNVRIGRVFHTRWDGEPTVEDFACVLRDVAAARQAAGEPLIGISLITEASRPPGEAARAAMRAGADALLRDMECAIYIVEGRGFLHEVKLHILTWLITLHAAPVRIVVRNALETLLRDPPPNLSADWPALLRELRALGLIAPSSSVPSS
jgi:hypothetical protein